MRRSRRRRGDRGSDGIRGREEVRCDRVGGGHKVVAALRPTGDAEQLQRDPVGPAGERALAVEAESLECVVRLLGKRR